MIREKLRKRSAIAGYGLALAVLLVLMKWLELRFVIYDHAFEIYAGAIALLFTGLGIWLAIKLTKPKVERQIVEKTVYLHQSPDFVVNEDALRELGISIREQEVLQLMGEGFSNREIGEKLFVSENTVKTHAARVFEKLEVKRRTQAVDKARKMGLIR
jgi:NarL family two-component system response regulator LiaR